MSEPSVPLWKTPELRVAAGNTLRPGGFALTDRAAEILGVLPGWRVLDVGCGLGGTVGRLRSRYGAHAWGVDFSMEQLADADGLPGLIRAKGDCLPFRTGTFNAVFCECVLSLLDDRVEALAEFARVLKPGGYLVLTDLYSGDGCACHGDSCATRAASLAEVRGLLSGHGFTVTMAEDHSPHLRDLAARLVWVGGGRRCGCEGHLSYYLMIARQGEITHAG